MKRLISLGIILALALSIFPIPSFAYELTPYEFIQSQGFTVSEPKDAYGYTSYCTLTCSSSYQALFIVYDEMSFSTVGDYDADVLQAVFIDLVGSFEWERLSYSDQISGGWKISYGIPEEVNASITKCTSQAHFLQEMLVELGLSTNSPLSTQNLSTSTDLSALTFDELLALRKEITSLLWASDEWQEVTVPAGVYEIGIDIPAGQWTITAADHGYWLNCKELDEYGDGKKDIHSSSSMKPGECVNWNLIDGTYLEINGCSVVFTPYIGADLGFK